MAEPARHRSERQPFAFGSRAWIAVLVLAALAVVALSAVSTQLVLRMLAPEGDVTLSVAPVGTLAPIRISYTPGATQAAALPPAFASPAAGTTGTAELPPMPVTVSEALLADAGADTIVPAKPFPAKVGSATDRSRAFECLTAAIYYEAASESDDGQRAVAQVVLNRVRHPAFADTVCGVVYQGSERRGCQFSFACDGSMARIPSRAGWARAARNAAAALAGYVFAPVGLATHYHTYAVTPAWNRTLVMTDAIGAHFFHRWKGYWGTAPAFRQRYVGGEPEPGPHKPIEVSVIALAGAPATVSGTLASAAADVAGALLAPPSPARIDVPGAVFGSAQGMAGNAAAAITPAAAVQPEHRDSGQAITPYRNDDASQIVDRWKDTGKPIK